MQKTGIQPKSVAVMVAFALSCFGLLLFLWLSFGGPNSRATARPRSSR